MVDERLLGLLAGYSTGVLSWVQADGYPASARCRVRRAPGSELVEFETLPATAAGVRGPACLLFHVHDERLEGLRQLVVKGVLEDAPDADQVGAAGDAGVAADAGVRLRVTAVVTANGRPDTDRMPHAGAPLHMLRFYLLGRRQAKAYLARRAEPWPPIPFDAIARAVHDEAGSEGPAG